MKSLLSFILNPEQFFEVNEGCNARQLQPVYQCSKKIVEKIRFAETFADFFFSSASPSFFNPKTYCTFRPRFIKGCLGKKTFDLKCVNHNIKQQNRGEKIKFCKIVLKLGG